MRLFPITPQIDYLSRNNQIQFCVLYLALMLFTVKEMGFSMIALTKLEGYITQTSPPTAGKRQFFMFFSWKQSKS
jgi:hypothetical protein